jgi:hypothetical protein
MKSFISCTSRQILECSNQDGYDGWNMKHSRERSAYKILKNMMEISRPRRRRDDEIKIYLRDIRWEGVRWINLVRDSVQWRAFMYTTMYFRIPPNTGKFLSG